MQLFYREVFRHVDVLRSYLGGRLPDFDTDLQRGLFLRERARDPSRPDHFLKAAKAQTVGKFKSLPELMVGTINWMQETFLREDGHRHLCVPTNRFEAWQELLTEIPPLLVVADALRRRHWPLSGRLLRDRAEDFLFTRVRPQVRFSSLPTVRDSRLDYLIRTLRLDEMHMHLNGGTEAEQVWIDALGKPEAFTRQFLRSELDSEVIEQLQQDDPDLTHRALLRRLQVARALRRLLTRHILFPLAGCDEESCFSNGDLQDLLSSDFPLPTYGSEWNYPADEHPVTSAYGAFPDATPLMMETLFISAILARLEEGCADWLSHATYAYFLLKAQFMRMLVQQKDQYGFDQFQKITVNEMRELTERKYCNRFHQLDYTPAGDLDVLEGRFAPKSRREDMMALLGSIIQGYQEFHGRRFDGIPTFATILDGWTPDGLRSRAGENQGDEIPPPRSLSHLRLALVGHFIKAKDRWNPNSPSYPCRYYQLRKKLREQWGVLSGLFHDYPALRNYVVGFDAAANELHAPPEVFAPLFRAIRRDGFNNFSYHAGEDFVHLLSGIRAVYEALMLVNLRDGNRLGHATAVGIEPELWRSRMGSVITLTCGQRLDDLVLSYRLLAEIGDGRTLVRIGAAISQLSRQIYGEASSPEILYAAWEMRSLDPLVAFDFLGTGGGLDSVQDKERRRVEDARDDRDAFNLFTAYHGALGRGDVVARSSELISIDKDAGEEPVDEEHMRLLQESVLRAINDRHVAIETLPTSNVRISVYRSYSEHHIFRWLGLSGPGERVNVCVGSDDPGIFGTNLRNEYAHLLRELDSRCAGTGREPLMELRMLVENGKIWRFSHPN